MWLSFCRDILDDISNTTTSRWCLQHSCIVKEIIQNSHLGYKFLSSSLTWDCSACGRTYALFLEKRHACYHVLKYDTEAERLARA
ncbi:unnamed protein product [Brassica rapa subsp. narinosa]|uniref:(rape) hypothetical protein n=1 Tax=Brassica napus TaxID=3708 RepID=A0A816TI96_BRANA|nr:unnamed protein product [Brassica napus]